MFDLDETVEQKVNLTDGKDEVDWWSQGRVELVMTESGKPPTYTIRHSRAFDDGDMEHNVPAEDLRRPRDDKEARLCIFTHRNTRGYRTKYGIGTVKKDYFMRKKFILADLEGKGSPMWVPVRCLKGKDRKLVAKADQRFTKETKQDELDEDYMP